MSSKDKDVYNALSTSNDDEASRINQVNRQFYQKGK